MEHALSGLLLAGFILLPGAFLHAFFQGLKVSCHHLSDSKFFEPLTESVSLHLLTLLLGLAAVQLANYVRIAAFAR
ncbi:MAG: hypothetical protein HY814_01095 [Candidatus Riflebacteria bacterium]|nr:hypothetical protein [Candidatus Riflebacteria bacterium]